MCRLMMPENDSQMSVFTFFCVKFSLIFSADAVLLQCVNFDQCLYEVVV